MAAPHSPSPRAPRLSAAERRVQLAHIAAQHFHRLGYHRVSLEDVAAEAGITGPGVYRHFRNKEALLAAAITSGLGLVEEAVTRSADGSLEELVSAVAEVSLHRPDMWVLLQRESRFLRPELSEPVQEQFGRVVDGFARRLRRERPELTPEEARLLITAATAVLSLPSTTRTSLTPAEYRCELASAATMCLRARLHDAEPVVAHKASNTGNDAPATRRDQLVDTAVDLFFRQGYSGVSLDEIGAAVGMAGPSVLHHFATKADILVAAFDQASEKLNTLHQQRRSSRKPPVLADLVSSYVTFCLENRSLLGVYVSESMYLPETPLDRARHAVRTELNDWTRTLLAASLDLDEHIARVRVRGALAAINDLVRLGHVADRPGVETEIKEIALAVLRARE